MVRNLRADMEDTEFTRFKRIKAELGAENNDDAIVALMDLYEEVNDDAE
jgi:hypothetical protein